MNVLTIIYMIVQVAISSCYFVQLDIFHDIQTTFEHIVRTVKHFLFKVYRLNLRVVLSFMKYKTNVYIYTYIYIYRERDR